MTNLDEIPLPLMAGMIEMLIDRQNALDEAIKTLRAYAEVARYGLSSEELESAVEWSCELVPALSGHSR